MVSIDLTKDFGLIPWILKRKLEVWVSMWSRVLLKELKDNTPEDTRKMLNSYRVKKETTLEGVVSTISNDAEHAIAVEYWVSWKSYNYHKPKGTTFYKWEGNRTFARSADNKRREILDIIITSLW